MKPFCIPSPGEKPLVIAEIALAHDGSLGNAIAYIRACADAGADANAFTRLRSQRTATCPRREATSPLTTAHLQSLVTTLSPIPA